MQYLKFTFVDAVTNISVSKQASMSGMVIPTVVGLEFVWARESAYPTEIPELYGTCPDSSLTAVTGVLAVIPESEWLELYSNELKTRFYKLDCSIRNQRKKLLSDSDWTQLGDAPVDFELWTVYRQALRDLTKQVGFPQMVEWPVEPLAP